MSGCSNLNFLKIRLFETNEDFKNYFEKFKNLNNEQLLRSQVLLNHATVVMEAIDTAITEIDDADKTHNKLKKLGLEHKVRGVKEEHIAQIREPFLKSVENTLGDRYSDRMRNIYEVFIDYVIKTIIEGYKSA
jgi:hemoglobin-like flavoprotein